MLSWLQLDEQEDLPFAVYIACHHDAIDDFRDLLHLPINFRRSNPHSAHLERSVAASVNNYAAARRNFSPVALTPDVRKYIEVCCPVTLPVCIGPKTERHGREWQRANEFSRLTRERPGAFIEDLHPDAETEALDFAGPNR